MSALNNNTDIYTSTTFEPSFNWQVGFNNFNTITSGVTFRTTVRPLTNFEQFSRIPNPIILYEETGVILDDSTNLGLWQFTLAKNLLTTGGPYRNYQVVVEAHDENGNTSAGNVVGIGGDSENGWTAYANGYDIIAVQNPRPSGIGMSDNLSTQNFSTGSYSIMDSANYDTTQYMGVNGEVVLQYIEGDFSPDIVGGFLYCYTGQFPRQEIFSDGSIWQSLVQKTRFTFDPNTKIVHVPTAAFQYRNNPYIYASISFFDTLDEFLLNNGTDISSNLYVSDNAIITNNASTSSLFLVGSGGGSTIYSLTITGYIENTTGLKTSYVSGLVHSGTILGAASTSTFNIPATLTTIIYMTVPQLQSGINVTTPGGFYSGMHVLMADGTTKTFDKLNVGDSVKSISVAGFDSVKDNWKTAKFGGPLNNTILLGRNLTSNIISGIVTNNFSSYYILNNDITGSFEEPILTWTGRPNGLPVALNYFSFNSISNAPSGINSPTNGDCSLIGISGVTGNFIQCPKTLTSKQLINSSLTTYNLIGLDNKLFFVSGAKGICYLVHQGIYGY